ncbi:hypothetical protein VTK56DRAFT_6658 [Thermocarpiscus australiensis]
MDPATECPNHSRSFQASQDAYETFPVNLVRKEAIDHVLERCRDRLAEGKSFHPRFRSLDIVDLHPQKKEFYGSQKIDTVSKLRSHLDEGDVAPYWRFVFLRSVHARGALGCSREQLSLLLTHYQVMPAFLDFVLTFKAQERPVSHAVFRQESYLDKESPEFCLDNNPPRSGIQIQHAFNLLSVERSSDCSSGLNQWKLRQVAVYHSLDVQNGRSVWIVLKGNHEIGRRIHQATKSHRLLKGPAIAASRESSFAASLQVHAIVVDWCAENWAQYISFLDDEISNSVGAKIAAVDEATNHEQLAQSFARKSTTQSSTTPVSGSSPPQSTRRPSFGVLSAKGSPSSWLRKRGSILGTLPLLEEKKPAPGPVQEENVSFNGFQRLSLIQDELNQAMRAIDQNRGVLKGIEAHYREVTMSHGFTTHMDAAACESHLKGFYARIRSTDRDLGRYYSRLEGLCRTVENDKAVFNAIISFKSEKTAEFFALSAKTSSEKMEAYSQNMEAWTRKMHEITVRTEQETTSMHIITIITLIFLPGRFSRSGVLHWDDDGNLGYYWVVRGEGIKLFLSICLPMMALILVGWFAVYLYNSRRGRAKIQDAEAITIQTVSTPL